MSYKDYSVGTTGGDSLDWEEKEVADCPQRGSRPALDLSPEGDDFYTKVKFDEDMSSKGCMEDFDDLPYNELNEPVDLRTKVPADNGWLEIASDVSPTAGTSGKGGNETR